MKNTISIFIIMLSLSLNAQTAPTNGKKVLEVKETYHGEYLTQISSNGVSTAVKNAMKKRLPKLLEKYGFDNVTIDEIGSVSHPESDFKFQANITNNENDKKFKIRLATMSYVPKYIIQESEDPMKKSLAEANTIQDNIDYCSEITSSVDKFEKKTTYYTPFSQLIGFSKSIDQNGNGNGVYMSITARGSSFNVGKKGMTILFADGSSIEKANQKIDVKTGKNRFFDYKAFFKLSDDEIEKLTSSEITDVKLYVYTEEIKNGKVIMEYFNCIRGIE